MTAEEVIQKCLDEGSSASDIVEKLGKAGITLSGEEGAESPEATDEAALNGSPEEGEPSTGDEESEELGDKPPAPHSDQSYLTAIRASMEEMRNKAKKSPMEML